MEIQGHIIAIMQARTGVSQRTGKEWMSQEYVLETNDRYPKKMVFNVFGADKIQQFNLQVGQEYTVSFDIDARQWQDRWFNSINAWNAVPADSASQQAVQPAQPAQPAQAQSTTTPTVVMANQPTPAPQPAAQPKQPAAQPTQASAQAQPQQQAEDSDLPF